MLNGKIAFISMTYLHKNSNNLSFQLFFKNPVVNHGKTKIVSVPIFSNRNVTIQKLEILKCLVYM